MTTFTQPNTFRAIARQTAFDPPLYQTWYLKQREQTGMFIVSQRGTLLARIDQKSGLIYFWDKTHRMEIIVPIRELFSAFLGYNMGNS